MRWMLLLILSGSALASTPMPPCLGDCAPTPDHAYFDFLRSHPNLDIAVGYHNQADVERYHHGAYDHQDWSEDPANRPHYDPEEDAQKWPMANGKRSYFIGQSRIPLRTSNPAVSLFYWEVKWHPSWADRSNWNDGMGEHKAFQLTHTERVTWTINERYDWRGPYPDRRDIAKLSWSLRTPWDSTVDADNQEPPTNWAARAGVWTRYWYWVDMANEQAAVWVADEERPNPTFLGVSRDITFRDDREMDTFVWEWNMSRSGEGNASTPVYGRNFVHIRDISLDEARELVER